MFSLLPYLLAMSILSGPDVSMHPDPATLEKLFPVVNREIKRIALQWEILDPREKRYVMVRDDEFLIDLRMLQRRLRELYDAPPLHEADRFPDRATVNELLIFNRSYRQYIDAMIPLYPLKPELKAAKDETELLYQLWDAVRDARCDYYYVHIRRAALKKLRDQLGPKDYASATLPPHVPLWRFVEGK
jgi:hypothetical protein